METIASLQKQLDQVRQQAESRGDVAPQREVLHTHRVDLVSGQRQADEDNRSLPTHVTGLRADAEEFLPADQQELNAPITSPNRFGHADEQLEDEYDRLACAGCMKVAIACECWEPLLELKACHKCDFVRPVRFFAHPAQTTAQPGFMRDDVARKGCVTGL